MVLVALKIYAADSYIVCIRAKSLMSTTLLEYKDRKDIIAVLGSLQLNFHIV